VLALGGLAVGIAASRFLKASSNQRYQRRQTQRSHTNGGSPSFGDPAAYTRESQPVPASSQVGIPTGTEGW
jgi:hypothetical protein